MNRNFDSSAITQKRMAKSVALFQHTQNARINAGNQVYLSGSTANVNASMETDAHVGKQYCCGPSIFSPPRIRTPDSPSIVSVTPGNTQVTVAFTAPSYDGGSPILSYQVTSSPGGFTTTGSSSPLLVTGLTNGTSYTFTVIAINALGNSTPSTSSAVTPATSKDTNTHFKLQIG